MRGTTATSMPAEHTLSLSICSFSASTAASDGARASFSTITRCASPSCPFSVSTSCVRA